MAAAGIVVEIDSDALDSHRFTRSRQHSSFTQIRGTPRKDDRVGMTFHRKSCTFQRKRRGLPTFTKCETTSMRNGKKRLIMGFAE